MRILILICILLIAGYNGYSQDSLNKKAVLAEIEEFNKDSFSIRRYSQFPRFIKRYFKKRTGWKLKLARRKFNSTDLRSPWLLNRKFMYAGGSSHI